MGQAPLHIAVMTTDSTITDNRAAFIRGRRQAGHHVDVVTIGKAVYFLCFYADPSCRGFRSGSPCLHGTASRSSDGHGLRA